MDILEEKAKLITWLKELNDDEVLKEMILIKEGFEQELSEGQKELLDKRLEAHSKSPESGSSWDDVKARILKNS